jgi:hypothetical protein
VVTVANSETGRIQPRARRGVRHSAAYGDGRREHDRAQTRTIGIITNGANARVRVVRTYHHEQRRPGIQGAGGSFINDLGGNVLIGNTTNGVFN